MIKYRNPGDIPEERGDWTGVYGTFFYLKKNSDILSTVISVFIRIRILGYMSF